MRIYNTLARSVEELKPIHEGQVYMYTCGPTVYDYMHIGNLRTFLLSDLITEVYGYKYCKKVIYLLILFELFAGCSFHFVLSLPHPESFQPGRHRHVTHHPGRC